MRKIISIVISVMLFSAVLAGCAYAEEAAEYIQPQNELSAGIQDGDYTYLFENGSTQKRNIPLNDVERIAILFTSSPLPQSLLLDLEDMKSYYDPGRDIYYNIEVSKYIKDMSENEKNQLNEIWLKGAFESWDFYYEGMAELDYECHLSVETEDTVYHYEIKGVDAPAPDSLTDFITELLHAFWNSDIISQ